MKVRKLIELLQTQDPDREVILSKDGEGNSYSPACDFSTGAYAAETTWCGSYGLEELTEELEKQGYLDEDVIEDGVPCLVLWPIN